MINNFKIWFRFWGVVRKGGWGGEDRELGENLIEYNIWEN